MLHIRFTASGIDNPKEAVIGFFIDNHIVNNAPLVIEQKPVKSVANGDFGKVIGKSVLG